MSLFLNLLMYGYKFMLHVLLYIVTEILMTNKAIVHGIYCPCTHCITTHLVLVRDINLDRANHYHAAGLLPYCHATIVGKHDIIHKI